jgi:iron(III) transport system ATP-binding protein
LAVSDEIIVMNQGAIAQQGAPRALYETPNSLFIATFIGDANILTGDLTAAKTVEFGDLRFPIEPGPFDPGPVTVAVRPNGVRIEGSSEGGLAGTIEKATYVGTHVEYTVETRLGALFIVDDTTRMPLAIGEPVSLQMDPEALILVPPG